MLDVAPAAGAIQLQKFDSGEEHIDDVEQRLLRGRREEELKCDDESSEKRVCLPDAHKIGGLENALEPTGLAIGSLADRRVKAAFREEEAKTADGLSGTVTPQGSSERSSK